MLNAKHGIYLPSSRKCGNQCLVHSTGRVAAVAIIWLQYAGKYREAAFVTSKLREEKLYREISTISLDPKAQPVVPSEKDGKCKHTEGKQGLSYTASLFWQHSGGGLQTTQDLT